MKYNIDTKYNIKVLANRPVSLHCNSGRTLHMPPAYACDIAGEELISNLKLEKLISRKLLSVSELKSGKPRKKAGDDSKKKKPTTKAGDKKAPDDSKKEESTSKSDKKSKKVGDSFFKKKAAR